MVQDEEHDYDKEKYVSYAEYLRDVKALKNKEIKSTIIIIASFLAAIFNIWIIRFTELDSEFDWIVGSFAMDQIMAWIAVLFVLLIPGIWIGVSLHKMYALVYFAGFTSAGFIAMFFEDFFILGLYVFCVSFFLLILLYLIFYKIWMSLKGSVAKPKFKIE